MDVKLIIKIAVLIAVGILAYLNRGLVTGVLLGGAGAVVYFTLTGSTLNFIWKKKA